LRRSDEEDDLDNASTPFAHGHALAGSGPRQRSNRKAVVGWAWAREVAAQLLRWAGLGRLAVDGFDAFFRRIPSMPILRINPSAVLRTIERRREYLQHTSRSILQI